MQKLNFMQRLTDGADLQGELPPGVPVVEIAGDSRVLIERHNGMTEYSRERICVKVCYGAICICGSELELAHMTQYQLVISGRIDCVKILRGRR